MQSTGQTSTQAVSFVPTHGSQMMYATLMSSKPKADSKARSITRARVGLLAVGAMLACTNLRSDAQVPAFGQNWREAPQYVELFAPREQRAAYRAYISPVGLDATLAELLEDPAVLQPPGAWTPQAMIPYDAFGLSGSYNRWKVAGL